MIEGNSMSLMQRFHARHLLSLNYDVTIPICKDDEIVQRRTYSIDDVHQRLSSTDSTNYFDRLKEKSLSKKSSTIMSGKQMFENR